MTTEPSEFNIQKTESEWKASLDAEAYRVLREKGTEYPGTGEYDKHFEKGAYHCRACDLELFDSSAKFDAHCGWPSFDDESTQANILKIEDNTLGMKRVEIVCSNCGGHLGHIFPDGPTETGMRYCVNSVSLSFKPSQTDSTSTDH
ncbi:MAG: peptide-methionine (R)-S-oxide reductase MsrB [Flavobacteriales bacterium]